MRALRISDNLMPISEFKAKAAECLRRLNEDHAPLVITQNGRAAGVLLAPEVYDALTEHLRFMAALEEGNADVQAGRVMPHAEFMTELREEFGDFEDA